MKHEKNLEKKPEMKPAQPVQPLPIPEAQPFHPVRPAPPVLPVQPLPLPGKLPITHVQSAQSAKPIPAGPPIRVECEGMEAIEEAAIQQTAKQPTPEPEQARLCDPYESLIWVAEEECIIHRGCSL